jgi:hypothetical protein
MLSKKLQAIDSGYTTYRAIINGQRYAKAWYDPEDQKYYIEYGDMGMPADFTDTSATIEGLGDMMRDFANLRHWTYYSE